MFVICIVIFRNRSTIASGKSGNKNVNLKDKHKGTKFPNESNFVGRSQILCYFLTKKTYAFFRENAIISA